jgi:YesN/AraC family two-component response regulator
MQKYEILLVDDDPFILQSIAPVLENEGYNVTTAANGKEAIKLLEKKNFDLVLTDLVMDPIDGIGVLKKTKELDPDTIVIILTGFGDFF